ncbi:MAG: GNAT family N-acetyltransferase [Aeromicrobium erythreum]
MRWRVRATLSDRPGLLAGIASACGEAGVNILGLQVFPVGGHVVDELVVEAPEGWTELRLADLLVAAGGTHVSVTRVTDDDVEDGPTRYLQAVHRVLEDGEDVETVLHDLLDVEPPDVADYAGHDVLDIERRNGSVLRISRAVPFTPVERARAQALVSLVNDAGHDVPLLQPTDRHPLPIVRTATLADLEAVAALHSRCSVETLYTRYQVPLRMPMTTRMTRRLVVPERGVSLVVQAGLDVVAHGVLEQDDQAWTFQLLVEDAWQGRGLGTLLVRHAAGRAKALGARHLVLVSADSNDTLLRAVGSAGFVARVERHDGAVHVTVPLDAVRAIEPA